MKIEYNTLTIQNFMSFGNVPTVIKLDEGLTNLILGDNRDVGAEGYSRNGVGKSTALQALMWVMFDEVLNDVKKDEIINIFNKKNLLVTLEFKADGVPFKIERGRKPAILSVTRDGQPYTMHSTDTVDETIRQLVGMNATTFENTQLLTTSVVPFMAMKPAGQRNFMEQMVGLDVLTERAELLKAKNKNVDIEIRLEEKNLEHAKTTYENAKIRLERLESKMISFDKTQKETVEELKNNLNLLISIDTDEIIAENDRKDEIAQKRVSIKEHIAELKAGFERKKDKLNMTFVHDDGLVKSQESAKIADLKENVKQAMEDLNKEHRELTAEHQENRILRNEAEQFVKDAEKEIRAIEKLIDKNQREIDALSEGECPYCHQEHFDKDKVKALKKENKDKLEEKQDINEECVDVETQIDLLENTMDDCKKRLADVTKKMNAVEDILSDDIAKVREEFEKESGDVKEAYVDSLDEVDAESRIATKELEDQLAEINTLHIEPEYTREECAGISTEITMTKKQLASEEEKTNPYTDEYKTTKEEFDGLVVDEKPLYALREKSEHYKILIKMLTDNKSFVRRRLLDQYVPYLNQKIDSYCVRLGLPHKIEISNDLSVNIEYMQRGMSYGLLSKGERGRLNFSTSMAFRDLLSMSGFQYNILCIDELLDDGMDTSGFHDIFKVLEESNVENLFLISHRDDLVTQVDNIINVVKENGFTIIE